eukprot:Skav220673  [mRNA]  locus=scaffold1914:273793:279188:+ [translate_table: standard]
MPCRSSEFSPEERDHVQTLHAGAESLAESLDLRRPRHTVVRVSAEGSNAVALGGSWGRGALVIDGEMRYRADCWADFMLLRGANGSKAMSRFASPEHEALSRPSTVGAAGSVLCNAFDQLDDNERAGHGSRQAVSWLRPVRVIADYVVVIPNASRMLQNAKALLTYFRK